MGETDPRLDGLKITNIHTNVTERVLYELLIQAGQITELRMQHDKDSGEFRGVAFCRYKQKGAADYALHVLNSARLFGKPIRVSRDRQGEDPERKIFVGNLPFHLLEEDVFDLFCRFGAIDEVVLPREEDDRNKGFSFIVFETLEAARAACTMNGYYYQQRPLKVNPAKRPAAVPAASDADATTSKLKRQVEYYLSEANLRNDTFLREKMDADGQWPTQLLAGFNMIKKITGDESVAGEYRSSCMLEVINVSAVLELSADGTKVRRK